MTTLLRTSLDLPVALSADETAKMNAELVRKTIEKQCIEDQKRAEAAGHNVKIKALRKEIQALSTDLDRGSKIAEVPCEEREGTVNGAVDVFRMDRGEPGVGEHVKTITEGEAHGPLFDGASSKKGRKSKKSGMLNFTDTHKKPEGDDKEQLAEELQALATGEPDVGIGEDGLEYFLNPEQADLVRTGKDVTVQGIDGTGEMPITKLKARGAEDDRSAPKTVSTKKSRARATAEAH